ncbi:MAG TPA: MHYT domain-containing protein [Bryobacteraceae bacterium]|jgi:signal transduction histidine kinase|nr:MHYT domain-containing protein [Bryobacteraceae bacterium]
MNSSSAILAGSYDYWLVAWSILIAVAASYAAFDLAGRVNAARGWARLCWLVGGATATGIGTWSLHYVGMLAFRLPVPVQYHWPTALLSLLAAVLSYVAALVVVSRRRMGSLRTLCGGALMGGGIVALHYIAMDSMRLPAMCHYSPVLVILSVAVAVAGSLLALRLMFVFSGTPTVHKSRRLAGGILMSVAIAGMHYTAMTASTFTPSETFPDRSHVVSVTALGVAGMVVVPLMVLGIAVLTSMVDRLQRSFEHLRALASRLETVREEERRRIAREIHDELGQSLTAIKIELSSLLFEWPPEQKPSTRAESITRLIDQTIESVRKISTELRPGILDALGLVAAVEWAAEEFEARTGTRCRLDLPKDDLKIDQEQATAIFRIFQETLTNIARHANATQVDVRLAKENGSVSLEVHDNGIGISEERLSACESLGILGMRERALLLGGEFLVRGEPNQGTLVRVRIPLFAPHREEQAR